jgi:hypothetical protein
MGDDENRPPAQEPEKQELPTRQSDDPPEPPPNRDLSENVKELENRGRKKFNG